MPFVHPIGHGSAGSLAMPLPPRAPPGTGAVRVNSGPASGSITTGFKESF